MQQDLVSSRLKEAHRCDWLWSSGSFLGDATNVSSCSPYFPATWLAPPLAPSTPHCHDQSDIACICCMKHWKILRFSQRPETLGEDFSWCNARAFKRVKWLSSWCIEKRARFLWECSWMLLKSLMRNLERNAHKSARMFSASSPETVSTSWSWTTGWNSAEHSSSSSAAKVSFNICVLFLKFKVNDSSEGWRLSVLSQKSGDTYCMPDFAKSSE